MTSQQISEENTVGDYQDVAVGQKRPRPDNLNQIITNLNQQNEFAQGPDQSEQSNKLDIPT